MYNQGQFGQPPQTLPSQTGNQQMNTYAQLPPQMTSQQNAFSSNSNTQSGNFFPPPVNSFYGGGGGASTQSYNSSFSSTLTSLPSYPSPVPPASFASQLPPTLYGPTSSSSSSSQLPPPPSSLGMGAQQSTQFFPPPSLGQGSHQSTQFIPLPSLAQQQQQTQFFPPPSLGQGSQQSTQFIPLPSAGQRPGELQQYPVGTPAVQQPQLQFPPQPQMHSSLPPQQAYTPFPPPGGAQPAYNPGPGMFPPPSHNFGVGVATPQVENWVFELSGQKLDRKDIFSPSDPFLNLYAFRGDKSELENDPHIPNSDSRWKLIHRTEVVMDNANPHWKPFVLDVIPLCDGDRLKPFLIDCYDHDSDGSHDFIGSCLVTLLDLQQKRKIKFENPKRWGFGNVAGYLIIKACNSIQK